MTEQGPAIVASSGLFPSNVGAGTFPNKAGDHEDSDAILTEELHAAGIESIWDHYKPGEMQAMREVIRKQSGEVKTSVIGGLHGWAFKRAWYYWEATGPGIDVWTAELLHKTHGKVVRVDGDAGCQSPREAFKGLAVGRYHVDTPAGLKALADTIKSLVAKNEEFLATR
jgi:hypothetical protein